MTPCSWRRQVFFLLQSHEAAGGLAGQPAGDCGSHKLVVAHALLHAHAAAAVPLLASQNQLPPRPQIAPTGMLFIPCRNGWSHRPDEFAAPADIQRGVEVLALALARLAGEARGGSGADRAEL